MRDVWKGGERRWWGGCVAKSGVRGRGETKGVGKAVEPGSNQVEALNVERRRVHVHDASQASVASDSKPNILIRNLAHPQKTFKFALVESSS